MKLRAYAWLPLAAVLLPQIAAASAFTPGNLVIYRVGDGGATLSSAGTAIFLDEYTPAGTVAQTIALPTAASGANKSCVGSGTATSEGLITRSGNGQYLVGACYATSVGTTSITTSASATINRVIARVDANGNVDTTTALTDAATGGNPRGAASADGSAFWMTGSTGGVRYASYGATTSTQLSTTTTNLRSVFDFASQLYVSSSSGAIRVASVGTGMPTTSGQTITDLTGLPTTGSPYQFVLLDLSSGVAGPDTLYVADDGAGILKYSLVGGTWTVDGTIGAAADGYRGLVAVSNGSSVTLYATSASKLYTVTDTSGYHAAPSTTTTTILQTAATNTAFRGIAFAPTTPTLTLTSPAPTTEGDAGSTNAVFTASLNAPAPVGGVTFAVNTADGSATAGSDYTQILNGTGTIAEGSLSATIPVAVLGDTQHEGDETFTLNLSSIVGTTSPNASAGATITDDDPLITLSIDNVTRNEGASGSTTDFTFAITLSSPAKSDVTFDIATADGTATTADNDYVANSLNGATIAAGSTNTRFTVTVNGDDNVEPDENFFVNVNNINGTNVTTTSAQGTGTIQNDDNVPITVSIGNVAVNEGDSGTTPITFTVSLSSPAPAGGVTFDITTNDGTATGGSDYIARSLTGQTIPAGQSSYQFTVQVNGDTTIEPDEFFFVDVSNFVGTGVTTVGPITGVGTIYNDDMAVTATVADVSQAESNSGTTTFTFTINLSGAAPASGVTFDIATADDTATAGSDYVAKSLTGQTIPPGGMSYQFDVTVNGDTTFEPNEKFFVNVTNITGSNVSPGTLQAVGTIQNDDPQPYTIMQIQGHGTASAMANQTVTTLGNVVTALKSNGFFMQDPAGDGDLTTSDGIFVFTSSAPTVHVGDNVNVTGKVQEFSGSTEMTAPVITVNSTGNTVPAAYVIDSNAPTNNPTTGICMGAGSTIANPPAAADGYQASNFACLDGMRVTIQNAIVTGSTFAQGQDGVHTGIPRQVWAKYNDGAPHPMRTVGALWPGLGAGIPVFNGEPEVITLFFPGLPAFDPTGFAYNDGTTFSVTGVMQGFTASGTSYPIYEIYPATMTTLNAVTASQEIKPVPASAAGTLTIGSQNLLHFFNDTADGADTSGYNDTCNASGTNDTCPNHVEYVARVSKWAHQICDVLHAPVVVDLEEIENLSVARDLVTQIGTTCGTTYVPYVIPGNDVSGINIGILARSDVVVGSVTQMYKGSLTSNCGGSPPPASCLLNDRPPVLMTATWNSYPFALLAIYDRSLSGLGDPTKPYIGPKRAEQAAQIAQIAQAFQSGGTLTGAGNAQQNATGTVTNGTFNIVGNASVPLIVAGDFNAYEFSDGYADVTGMIKGTAVQSQNLYWYSGSAVDTDTPAYVAPNPPLTDSGDRAAASNRYSYNFSGLRQEIDHVLLSKRAMRDFVSVGNAHGDADVSGSDAALLDGSTPARSGDHDGQVVTLTIDRIFADGYEVAP